MPYMGTKLYTPVTVVMTAMYCRSLAQRPEALVSAWLVGASPLVQIYQSLSMAEGEASCEAEWAAFVQQNISTPIVANVTAGTSCISHLAV